MTPRIEKAIDIFLDALNKGTLAKGTCKACAVGNLVAHGLGGKIWKDGDIFQCSVSNHHWYNVFCTNSLGHQYKHPEKLSKTQVLSNIEATDFSWEELAAIEYAFEINTYISHIYYDYYSPEEIRADQIKGLEAVVQVMLTFDDCKESVREVFTEKAELIPV